MRNNLKGMMGKSKALVAECASVEILDKAMGAMCGMAVGPLSADWLIG